LQKKGHGSELKNQTGFEPPNRKVMDGRPGRKDGGDGVMKGKEDVLDANDQNGKMKGKPSL